MNDREGEILQAYDSKFLCSGINLVSISHPPVHDPDTLNIQPSMLTFHCSLVVQQRREQLLLTLYSDTQKKPFLVLFLRRSQVSRADTHQPTQPVSIDRFCLDHAIISFFLPPQNDVHITEFERPIMIREFLCNGHHSRPALRVRCREA